MMKNDAIIILYDKEKKILLQYRGSNAPNVKNKWSFFGGGIESGESPRQGVERETLEELNYKLTDPKLIFTLDYDFGFKKGKKYCFVEKYDGKSELILGEGEDLRWFSFEELENLEDLQDLCRIFIEKVKEYLNA